MNISFPAVLPSEILKENDNAVDWGSCGIAAFTTGSTIHFFSCNDNNIYKLYSSDFRGSVITCLKFHDTHRWMAFGDDRGNVLLWNIERRGVFASYLPNLPGVSVLDMKWQGEIVVVLFSDNRLMAFSHSPETMTEVKKRITVLWEITLSQSFNRFSFDPHGSGMILLSGKHSTFSIYTCRELNQPPTSFLGCIELSQPDDIQDAQWSEHFENCIWVVLANEIVIFHIESRTIVPIIKQRGTASSFYKIVQLLGDHSQLIMMHKNGAMTIYKADEWFNFASTNELQPRHAGSNITKCCRNAMSDKTLFVVFSNLGAALVDTSRAIVLSSCFTFPVSVTAIDSNADHLVYGTKTGHVIIQSANGKCTRYFVCDSPLIYVGVTDKKVFWQGRSSIGEINLATRSVIEYTSRASAAFHCTSTANGALVVQRESQVLGVFVGGKERPVLLHHEVTAVSLETENSGPENGRFGVLQKNRELRIYSYSAEQGSCVLDFALTLTSVLQPSTFTFSGDLIVCAFENGSLAFYDMKTRKTVSKAIQGRNIRNIRVCGDALFGLCNDNVLFKLQNGMKTCPFPVKSYSIVDPDLLYVLCGDGIVRLVRVENWFVVRNNGESSLVNNKELAQQIENHPMGAYSKSATTGVDDSEPIEKLTVEDLEKQKEALWFRPETRKIWNCFREKPPISMQCHYALGDAQMYDVMMAKIQSYVPYITSEFQSIKYKRELFAGASDEAVNTLTGEIQDDSDDVLNGALAGCIIACEGNVSDKMITHMKSIAISLFVKGRYEEGATFLKIAKLDSTAAEYLMEYDQLDLALKFIRCLKGDEKRDMLTRLALKHLHSGDKFNAMMLFLSAEHYHVVLHLMQQQQMTLDAFFIKKYLSYKGILKPANTALSQQIRDLPDLLSLCAEIDSSFTEIASDFGVDPMKLRSLL